MFIQLTKEQAAKKYDGETEVQDDYPVYPMFTYLVDDRIEVSDFLIKTTVLRMRQDIIDQGRSAIVVRKCSFERKLDMQKEMRHGTDR